MPETCENCSTEPLEAAGLPPAIYAAHPYRGGAGTFPAALRKVAELRDGFAILGRALAFDKAGTAAPSTGALDLAALAVTGYEAFTTLSKRWKGNPAWTWGTREAQELANVAGLGDAVALTRATQLIKHARAIAMYLTANDPNMRDKVKVALLPSAVRKEIAGGRDAMRRRLGAAWIPVVGEADAPHHAVNTSATSLVERRTGPFSFVANETRNKRRKYLVDARYVVEGPMNAPVVVLLHGHSSKLEELDEVVPLLAKRFRVLVADLPGGSGFTRGELAPLATNAFRMAALDYILDFVLALVELLRKRKELPGKHRKVHFAGGSLGGNLALRLNARAAAIPGAGRFAAWSPGSAWYYPTDPEGDTSSPWMIFGWSAAASRMARTPNTAANFGWKDYFKNLESAIGGVVKPQPEHWYWDGWHKALRTQLFEECYESRREIFCDDFRLMHWQLAWEQMRFSHHGVASDTKHPYDAYTAPLLLMAGCRDNLFPERLATGTHDLYAKMSAAKMKNVAWRGFCDAGHSLHNERPRELARVLEEWFESGKVA